MLNVIRKAVLETSKKFKPETWEEVRAHRSAMPPPQLIAPFAPPVFDVTNTDGGSSFASCSVPRTSSSRARRAHGRSAAASHPS